MISGALCSYSWSQKSGDRSFGKKTERLLKCSKSIQCSSLSRASLYSAMLVLERAHTHTHTRNHFLPTLCREPNHLFLTDICRYPSPAFTLLLLHHTCSSPSRCSLPRLLQSSAITTSGELFPRDTSEETGFCTAVVLDEKIFKFHFCNVFQTSWSSATLLEVKQYLTAAGFIICKEHENTVG